MSQSSAPQTIVPPLIQQRETLENVLSAIRAARSSSAQLSEHISQTITNSLLPANRDKPFGKLAASRITAAFDGVRNLQRVVDAESTQAAFSGVRDAVVSPALLSGTRKRRHAPAASLPPAKRTTVTRHDDPRLTKLTLAFPDVDSTALGSIPALESYLRQFNIAHGQGLRPVVAQIWSSAKGKEISQSNLPDGTYIRARIRDTLTAYLLIGPKGDNDLIVETVSVTGVLEKKLPHAASDFAVFSGITQFIATLLQLQPQKASIPAVLTLIASYADLFSDSCITCDQTHSEEHLAPVERVWLPPTPQSSSQPAQPGRLVPRHSLCTPAPL